MHIHRTWHKQLMILLFNDMLKLKGKLKEKNYMDINVWWSCRVVSDCG